MQHDPPASCAGCGAEASSSAPSSGIGRRTFLAQSAVMAAIAALTACGAAETDTVAPNLGSGGATIKVSDQPALATIGGVALVTVAGSPLAIVRSGDTTFLALSRICPHQGSIVNTISNGFLCPNHGAQFSSTGTWVGGQRTSSMQSYSTAYDAAAGTVTVG